MNPSYEPLKRVAFSLLVILAGAIVASILGFSAVSGGLLFVGGAAAFAIVIKPRSKARYLSIGFMYIALIGITEIIGSQAGRDGAAFQAAGVIALLIALLALAAAAANLPPERL